MSKVITERDINNAKEALFDLIHRQAFIKFPFPRKLSSGITSEYYFDVRRIMLSLYGASLVDMIISDEILKRPTALISDGDAPLNETIAIGGLETGSLIIVGNLMNSVFLNKKAIGEDCIRGFYIRKRPKDHGLKNVIEGNVTKDDNIILVDDVITTGQSVEYSINRIIEHIGGTYDRNISKLITIVDRTEEHGYYSHLKNICAYRGIEYIRLFSSLQFINATYQTIR